MSNILILISITIVIGVLVAYLIKFMLYITYKIEYLQSRDFIRILRRFIKVRRARYKRLQKLIDEESNELVDHYYGK